MGTEQMNRRATPEGDSSGKEENPEWQRGRMGCWVSRRRPGATESVCAEEGQSGAAGGSSQGAGTPASRTVVTYSHITLHAEPSACMRVPQEQPWGKEVSAS